jgi:putative ABC transport system permease protein
MRALDRKLVRDLWGLKGQALAIALVIGGGVATFIMSTSVLDSLRLTQAVFYRDYRFADAWVALKRAPESVRVQVEAIPGVHLVETRVVAGANLEVAGFTDPVTAQILSLPVRLNDLYLKGGRLPEPSREAEVLVGDAFATAHGFRPGDHLYATINGKRRRLQIVGVALSPEYIYQLPPGAIIPDFQGYGVLWMNREPLAKAYDMEGAFNNLTLALSVGASLEDVIDRLDALLNRYGGQGAHGRKDQISHRYLSEEFRQLEQMATMFPAIFLGVAAFLLNVVVTRLVATQREQAAILKAFGYTNAAIVTHYLKLVLLIVLIGVAIGVAAGMWLGRGMSAMYMEFYRFPFMLYHLRPQVAMTAALISAAAALLGAFHSVYRAARLPPAEAMQPAPPARYRPGLIEGLPAARRLSQPTRMILRNLERRPVKALLSVVGIACACAILVVGMFFGDAVDHMIDIQFRLSQRDDITVTFVEPTSQKALYSLGSLPGVELVEPYRTVPARLRFGHRTYRAGVRGIPPGAVLYRLLDQRLRPVELPPEGVVLTDYLATILEIQPGDLLTVEVLEEARPVRQVPVAGLVREYIGVMAYMQLPALNRLMREGPAVSGVYLTTDPPARRRIYAELKKMPRVAGASVREKALQNFNETMARQILIFAFFNTILAGTIACGVVYNSARIALSERSRELATLRVMGYTRGEISYILLGELSFLTLAALPLGCLLGRGLGDFMLRSMQTDLFRIPLIIEPSTYSFAVTVVLVAAVLSGLLVRRKLDQLDLVAVLKTKE